MLDSANDVGHRIQPGYSGAPGAGPDSGYVLGLVSAARAAGPRDSLSIPPILATMPDLVCIVLAEIDDGLPSVSARAMTPWSNQTSTPSRRRMAVVAKVRRAVRWRPWCSVAPLRCSRTACAAMVPWPQLVSSPALANKRIVGVSAVLVSMNAVWEVPVGGRWRAGRRR
jgi:hypothetical protein